MTEAERNLSYDFEVDPATVGMSRDGVQRIARTFEQQFYDGLHYGGQLVVARHGQVVLDRTIGLRRNNTTQSVRPSTPFLTFSCTKPLAAVCLHQLIETNRVELDAPIAAYWPEFGSRGKEKATVRHLLTHQVGIPSRGLYPQIPNWWNWDRVVKQVAALEAEYEPGTKTAYHAVNYGFILGEIVRRISGRPIDQYIHEELFAPLGMHDSYLGLPTSEAQRSSEVYWGHPDQRNTVLLMRQARYAVMPAATLNTSARDLAKFYQMMVNGGRYNQIQILRPETARAITAVAFEGYDHVLAGYIRWGLGFGVGGPKPADMPQYYSFGRQSTPRTFGHTGQRSCNGWADWDQGIVFAYTTNRLIDNEGAIKRYQELAEAVWESLID